MHKLILSQDRTSVIPAELLQKLDLQQGEERNEELARIRRAQETGPL